MNIFKLLGKRSNDLVQPQSQENIDNVSPFFIVGCVRSGTTLIRNMLSKHPNLASPEETHFFRWSNPFGTVKSYNEMLKNQHLIKHRGIDGISETEFETLVLKSVSRSDLCEKYMRRFIEINKPGAKRWFDKTPQNVYGAAMIATEFPEAKFVHIVRNPMNVVSSLRVGKVLKVESIVGACNYWNEAAEIIYVLKKAYPERVLEVKYEELTANLLPQLKKILDFIGEDSNLDFIREESNAEFFKEINKKPEPHKHKTLFSQDEIETISRLCKKWGEHYEYFSKS